MFCARCGQQIPDASQICPLCGREANVDIQPTAAPAAAAPSPALEPQPEATPSLPIRKDLQGVGGWLLFFCVALVVLRPVLVLVEVFGQANVDAIGMAMEIALAVFGVVVGIFIWNVRPVAFTLLWIYFAIVVLFGVLEIIGFAVNPDESRPQDVMVVFRSLIYVVIWFLYFKRSERVRATFGRNL